ncbi:MAG: threonine ammonia-lyase, biosynthetic, partial [Magnetococcales bacterium]|nr:threonine ammonia-lyase, biosynthetic [Magnetococcales bacterium]
MTQTTPPLDPLVRSILTARVYEAAVETPLERSEWLSEKLDNHVFLKREDLQPVFSFKLRGAYNRIAHLSEEERSRGVIAASAGNHAQGVAFSARKLNIPALIVMPVTTPSIKVDAVLKYGAEVQLFGDNYSEAADHCVELAHELKRVFIHPFNDDLVIAGQGSVGMEIMRQSGGRMDAIFVPVGGGGLIAGVAAYVKALNPDIQVIGVEPEDSDAMTRSLEQNDLVSLSSVGVFADGVAVRTVGNRTFDLCRQHVDRMIRVGTDELCGAIKWSYLATRTIVEPAGALALAGLRRWVEEEGAQGRRLTAINSGANMNFERLRYVTERTLVGEQLEALFAITLPEEPGALRRFCVSVLKERNITEFNYRMSERHEAHIFLGVTVQGVAERHDFERVLDQQGYDNIDLTEDALAKNHIRHMVGGASSAAGTERLFRFWFPERSGALGDFLEQMG